MATYSFGTASSIGMGNWTPTGVRRTVKVKKAPDKPLTPLEQGEANLKKLIDECAEQMKGA